VRYRKFIRHSLIVSILLSTSLVFFDIPLGVFSLAQGDDAEAIRSLVGRLIESYQKKDIDRLISNWSEKSPSLAKNKKALLDEFAENEKIIVKDFEIHRMKIDGDKATLRVMFNVTLTKARMEKASEKQEKKNRTVELLSEGGVWKIWQFIASEEELATAIIAAKTEEERNALIAKEPDLITADLASALLRNSSDASSRMDYKNALMIAHLAYKIAERTGDQIAMANALISIGRLYGQVSNPEKSFELAIEYFRKALKIGEEYGHKRVISTSQLGLALAHHNLSRFSQAIGYYHSALRLYEEARETNRVIQILNNLGVIYRVNSNYAKALELLLKCLRLIESRLESGSDWASLSRALFNIGATFLVQGNYDQAAAYGLRAVVAAEKGIMLGDNSAKQGKATALALIGEAYVSQGNHSLAMDPLRKGLELSEGLRPAARDSLVASIKILLAHISEAENNTPQALANFEEALQLAERAGDKTKMGGSLLGLCKLYFLLGDYHRALAFSDRAAKAGEEVGQYPTVYEALVVAAKAYRKLSRPEDAHQALVRAIDIIERLQEQLAGGEIDRQLSFEYTVIPYQAMVDFQVEQKLYTEAFSYAQRAKGRTLLELLQNGRDNMTKSASPAEREEEQLLTRKIVSLNRELTSEKLKSQPDEERLADFEQQLKKARLEFDAFRTTLYAAHPEIKVQRGEIRPVSFDDAADLIPNSKTALLDFIVTDENVHLFVLTKEAFAQPTFNSYTLKIERKSLAEKVERYRGRMENRDYDFQALSKELYVLLIKPAQKQLQGKTKLIISPDNILWDLPFQTLLSPTLRYLIEDAAISYAPSLSVLKEMQLARNKNHTPAKASILALGNPALGTRSRELAKFVKMDAELQPLPEAAAQVRALGRLYGKTLSQVLTGPAAREELVKKRSARYRILHLATHGILNDASPMYSHILLSQTPGKSEEDGLLEAWEMMNLDLSADLVVLAACETARGRVGAGEGVIGMSWALFVAGCPRTVVSQWKVEASSTTALMVEFHKRFKTRYGGSQSAVSAAEAMRQAALKVMKNPEYVHPFYWGGFVVIGDGN
jgi:CHAT domain-containing protein/Flp pilus assembly protein TadD